MLASSITISKVYGPNRSSIWRISVIREPSESDQQWCTVPMIASSSLAASLPKSTPSNPMARSSSSVAPIGLYESMLQTSQAPSYHHRPINMCCERSSMLSRGLWLDSRRNLSSRINVFGFHGSAIIVQFCSYMCSRINVFGLSKRVK
ncbi:hypothetical protein SLE2022_336790 [Rubroshorea leprosula]